MTTTPTLSRTAELEQLTFRALLSALSTPGRVESLPPGRDEDGAWQGAISIAQALLDHEVTFHVTGAPAHVEEQILRRTGARTAPLDRAGYVFAAATHALEAVREAADGPLEEPERSSTVVLLCDSVEQGSLALRLTGPGIREEATVRVAGIDAAVFRALIERNWPFPTGIDVLLVDAEGRLVGLPRSTKVELTEVEVTTTQEGNA